MAHGSTLDARKAQDLDPVLRRERKAVPVGIGGRGNVWKADNGSEDGARKASLLGRLRRGSVSSVGSDRSATSSVGSVDGARS